jgi:hypothetical protein
LLRDEGDAELLAAFLLVKYSQPELRLRTVSVKLHDRRLSPSDRLVLSRLDVGSVVEVLRRPPGVGDPVQVAFSADG